MGRTYTEQEVAELIAPLLMRIEQLEAQNRELQAQLARLQKDSSNSSKPPSSDVTKPAKPNQGKKKRQQGGQKGHAKHERKPFPPQEVDRCYTYELEDTRGLEPLDEWRVVQQIELPEKLFIVTEHHARRYRCRRTGRIITAPLPDEVVKPGLLGPRLSTLVCYLKGVCHTSYRTVRHFLLETMGLDLSVGLLAKAVRRMTAALYDPYQQLIAALPRQPSLGIDETGLRHRGQGHWVWCAHAPGPYGLTCFAVDASRGSKVIRQMIGPDYGGVIGCDYFSAYRKYLADGEHVTVQFCWAHLIRDIKFMTDLPDQVTRNFADRLLEQVRKMFAVIHRRDRLTPRGYVRSLMRVRKKIIGIIRRAPNRDEPRKLAKRFRDHGDGYFTFMDHDGVVGVEPTNNATERQIRFVVLDRKVTQGTKGEIGNQWCERIWSTVATCRQRNKPIFAFLLDAIHAQIHGTAAPSLIYA
jgi:transposase